MIRRELLLVGLLVGCDPRPAGPPTPSAAPPVASAPSQEQPPRPHLAARPAGPWDAAGEGDALALRRLAEDLGATELWRVAESDDAAWPTALAALAEAPDADLVFEAVTRLALAVDERRAPALASLHAIAARPLEPVEVRDPEGLARAGALLDQLARDATRPIRERAEAVSILRALARRGAWDEARTFQGLDP